MATQPAARGPSPTSPYTGGSGPPQVLTNAEALEQVRRDFETIVARIKGPEIIARLADVAVHGIKVRTMQGRDVNDGPFEGYSETWGYVRAAKGRPTAPVDLAFSGAMMHAITRTVIDNRSARLWVQPFTAPGSPTPRNLIAERHQQGGGRTPKREFFGVSPTQKAALEREAARLLTLALIDGTNHVRPTGPDVSVLSNAYQLTSVTVAGVTGSPPADYLGIAGLGKPS